MVGHHDALEPFSYQIKPVSRSAYLVETDSDRHLFHTLPEALEHAESFGARKWWLTALVGVEATEFTPVPPTPGDDR
jgi:hypothetical protein